MTVPWIFPRLLWLPCCFFLLWAPPVLAAPAFVVQGGNQLQRENIEAWLGSPREGCDLPVMRERAMKRRVRNDTAGALKALGYYQPQITLDLQRDANCWQLRVRFSPGEPVRIVAIDVQLQGEAENDSAFIALKQSPPMVIGDPARHDQYEQLKNRLLRLAAERGYFESSLQRQALHVDVAAGEAVIELHVQSGPRYRFGEVSFEQDILTDKLLDKFVRFETGDPFDNRRLLSLRQSLSGSGYFADVRVRSEPDSESRTVAVIVSANPRARYVYTAGVGFATDTGPRFRLGMENRRVNRRGHRFDTGLELSPVRSGIGMNYMVPMGDPARERVTFSNSYLHEKVDDYSSDRYRLGVAHMRELESGWLANWMSTRSLDFEREFFTVAGESDRTDLLMPGYELSRVRSDDPIYPRRGWRLRGKVRVAHEDVVSTVSLVQVRGHAKWVFPTWYGRILMRVEGGATLADEVADLPSSVRFFTGGDNTIRGYAYQSLGPTNDDGDVIGGRHMLVGSMEYDIPFAQNWSWAVFVDGGNAYDALDAFDPVYGHGTGIRWRSPIGPLRLDIAKPSDGRDNFRLHISMGMDL